LFPGEEETIFTESTSGVEYRALEFPFVVCLCYGGLCSTDVPGGLTVEGGVCIVVVVVVCGGSGGRVIGVVYGFLIFRSEDFTIGT